MKYLYFFIASIFIASTSFASEDVDSFMFDDIADYIMNNQSVSSTPILSQDSNQEQDKSSPAPASNPAPEISNEPVLIPIDNDKAALPIMQKSNNETFPPEIEQTKPSLEEVKVNPNQDLTDVFSSDESKKSITNIPVPNIENTWVNKIKDVPATKTLDTIKNSPKKNSLEAMIDRSKKVKKRANASVFDISGVMLKMSVEQVDKIMQNRGYRKTMEKFEIPNFIKWRNEEKCRNNGVVGYERIESCIVQMAKKDKYQYVETTKYAKYDTKEEIEVKFTSNFTENKSYKISYTSMSASITGNSQKAIYLRNIKIYDFWKKINQKYGTPDNKDDVTWGMGGNKPYLQASTGYLKLEDPMFRELDFTRMSREDQRYMQTGLYSF